ncbi:MAG: S8 family serine peptidase [Candidatus Tectimicrobiota bacterium]
MRGGWYTTGCFGGGLVLFLSLLVGCGPTQPSIPASAEQADALPKQLRSQHIVVLLVSAPAAQWPSIVATLEQRYQIRQASAFPLASLGGQCVVFQALDESVLPSILERLRADPLVEVAQMNQVFQALDAAGEEPYVSMQYGLRLLQVPLAHRVVTGKGVQIALIDTGIALEHPDLQGQIAGTANFVEGGETSFQRDRHGTAVAGVMVARADNAFGMRGIAPQARLLAIKACWHPAATSQALCSSWSLARALDFAILQGVQVINLSLSGPDDTLLRRLLSRAEQAGIVVVAALPERQPGPAFPASVVTVLAVISSDHQGRVAGPVPRTPGAVLAAPGLDILTTTPPHTFDFVSGSSLATAHVSGLLALVLERFSALAPAALRQAVHSTAQPVAHNPPAALGLPDVCALLEHLATTRLCPTL